VGAARADLIAYLPVSYPEDSQSFEPKIVNYGSKFGFIVHST
jgi:hypothetical protein